MKNCSQFGTMLRKEREDRGIPLWKLAVSVPFPVSNLQRIETGITEPRIGIAMKMLTALDVDAGSFMQTLVEAQEWERYTIPDGFAVEMLAEAAEKIGSEHGDTDRASKMLFGIYFRHVRLACGLTQARIAARASYTTRSLIAVENGQQEPMVMRAVQLVWGLGIELKAFMGDLQKLHMNLCE